MATVYLHIGAPKTATSALQHVLAKNYKSLLKSGVLYPRDVRHGDAHHALVCDLIEKHSGNPMPDAWYGPSQRGRAWNLLLDEMKRHEDSCHSVVVSSELFFGQSIKLGEMLKDIALYLQGHDVRVIVYLRRQDQLFSSFYNQDVKGIRQWHQSAYEFYQTHQIFEQSYPALLNTWSQALGKDKMIIRPFEAGQWPKGNIVQDFCDSINVIAIRGTHEDHNESLGMIQLQIKRCLNRVGFDKSSNEEVVRILLKLAPEAPAKQCLYVHKRLYNRYRECWIEDNQSISQIYLNGAELFSQPVPRAQDLVIHELDPLATSGFIQNMFEKFSKGRYREFRQLFSRATLLLLADQNLWSALDSQSMATLVEWAQSS